MMRRLLREAVVVLCVLVFVAALWLVLSLARTGGSPSRPAPADRDGAQPSTTLLAMARALPR